MSSTYLFQYSYLDMTDTKTVNLEIMWNGQFLIDDDNAITGSHTNIIQT